LSNGRFQDIKTDRDPLLTIARFDWSSLDHGVALPPDQHADHQQIENVGADADGERGRIISEMVVEQAGDPAAGSHA
jgi:hypothetical protein